MAIDKQASRLWRGQIRDVLNQQWDPIGGCPADEYDAYVGAVATMLRDRATDEALMKYFEWAEAVHMGLDRFDHERASTVVASLRVKSTWCAVALVPPSSSRPTPSIRAPAAIRPTSRSGASAPALCWSSQTCSSRRPTPATRRARSTARRAVRDSRSRSAQEPLRVPELYRTIMQTISPTASRWRS